MLIGSLVIAFSMYSAIPMPRMEWEERAMRYALCFLPLVGAVIGSALALWCAAARALAVGQPLFAAVFCLIPPLFSGGIHLDGFCDTLDALASHRPALEKLRILRDPHTGAFAVVGVACYFLFAFGLACELRPQAGALWAVGLGFALSRALAAFSVTHFPCARADGLAHTFGGAATGTAAFWLLLQAVLCAGGMLFLGGAAGAAAVAAALLCFGYYRLRLLRQFGGVTGDLAGWYVQVSELAMLLAVVAVQLIERAGGVAG